MPATDFIGKMVKVKIDRPLGSRHPQHGFYYPINYGFVPGVMAPDGEELDAYVVGMFEPLEEFTGRCIGVIHRLDDDDDKLVLAPDGKEYSEGQILALTEFQERFFKAVYIKLNFPVK
jgi:inorganic pyrophosphatase